VLEINDNAVQEFKRLLKEKGKAGKAIRIFTMGSGCCGPTVGMDFVDQGQFDDIAFEREGVRFCIELKASTALDQMTIDYIANGDRKGFTLKNPASGSCCG
jgi:iron-sulfur cluster assembly accessory protein